MVLPFGFRTHHTEKLIALDFDDNSSPQKNGKDAPDLAVAIQETLSEVVLRMDT